MSLQPGTPAHYVSEIQAPCQLRPDWSFALASTWQVAVALDARSRRSDVFMALNGLLTLPITPTSSALERNLLRGFLLELARGLRAARRAIPAHHAHRFDVFCALLEIQRTSTGDLIEPARDLILQFREGDEPSLLHTAERIRALLDQSGPTKLTLSALARMLGKNVRYIDRAFRRRYGKSVAAYRREREAQAGLDAIVTGLPLKRAVDLAGCSESTLRRRIRALTGRTPKGWKGRQAGRISAALDS